MAFVTQHRLPRVSHINRMLKWKPGKRDRLRRCIPTLCDDCVATTAIVRDHLSIRAPVLPVVAPEAAGILEVADVVGISFPTDVHIGKEILLVTTLDFCNCTINDDFL